MSQNKWNPNAHGSFATAVAHAPTPTPEVERKIDTMRFNPPTYPHNGNGNGHGHAAHAAPVAPGPNASIQATNEAVQQASAWVRPLQQEMSRVIVGQKALVDRLLVALISNGHVLLEGVPGLAKTLALKTLAGAVHLRFQRLQFTPDMLPADIVGTMIYNAHDGAFRTKHGPIFSNLVLADEINRAPAKVQSALLEGM